VTSIVEKQFALNMHFLVCLTAKEKQYFVAARNFAEEQTSEF
jgi:hypothetical protein